MAKLSVDGLDGLMLSLEEIASIPDDVAQAMLDAEAQVVSVTETRPEQMRIGGTT